jgi:hypothetical protein
MQKRQLAAAIGFSVSLGVTADAQTSSTQKLPPTELGVGVDATWLREGLFLDTGIVTEPMVHIRVTQPMTPIVAIEVLLAVSKRFNTNRVDYGTEALYVIQIKQTVWRGARGGVFATYGAVGSWTRVLTHDTLHPPMFLIAGGGVERELARRAAVRVDAQGVMFGGFAPMGARLSAGVSVPLGAR